MAIVENLALDDGFRDMPLSKPRAFVFTASAFSFTAALDVWEIVAGTKKLRLKQCLIGQYTEFGDAAAELLSISIIKGYTTAGSGGSAVASLALNGENVPCSALVVKVNTTVASNGSPLTIYSDSWNVAGGWMWPPALAARADRAELVEIKPGERWVVRVSAPADSITANSTLILEEVP